MSEVTEVTAVDVQERKGPGLAKTRPVQAFAIEVRPAGVSALDDATARIAMLKGQMWRNSYEVGLQIRRVNEEQLWKARVGSDGKQVYKTLEDWVQQECGISPRYARDLGNLTLAYNADEVAAFGTTKLALVLHAPPEMKDRLLALVHGGASKKEIAREVRTAIAEKAESAPEAMNARSKANVGNQHNKKKAVATPSKKSVDKSAGEKAAPAAKTITAILKPGMEKIELFKAGVNPPTLARSLEDNPIAQYQTANGVLLTFAVKKDRGGNWFLVQKVERASEA